MSERWWFLVWLGLFFFSSGRSQTDSLEYLSYFPLQPGNTWQYQVHSFNIPLNTDTTYYNTVRVIGDTVLPNGKKYYALQGLFGHRFLRIDSARYLVYEYSRNLFAPDSVCSDSEIVIFNLVPPDTETVDTTCEGYPVFLYSGYGPVGLLNDSAYFIEHRWFWDVEWDYVLSKGFGVSYTSWEEGSYSDSRLVAAEINGVQYGEFVAVDPPGGVSIPAGFSVAHVYPNPFNAATTLQLFLPRDGRVTISVFDVLGRRVDTLADGEFRAGHHVLRWIGTDRATGIYLLTIRWHDQVRTQKMVLLK
jgi:hypothetical protein